MKKTLFISLLLLFFSPIIAQKTINSGYVFINGKYIEPPYKVSVKKDELLINNHCINKDPRFQKTKIPKVKKDPGYPPETIKTWDEYNDYKPKNSEHRFQSLKLIYLYTNYPDSIAKRKMNEYLCTLPFVIDPIIDSLGRISFKRSIGGQSHYFFWDPFVSSLNRDKERTNAQIKQSKNRNIQQISDILINGGLIASSNNEVLLKLYNFNEVKTFLNTFFIQDSLINNIDTIIDNQIKNISIVHNGYKNKIDYRELINNLSNSEELFRIKKEIDIISKKKNTESNTINSSQDKLLNYNDNKIISNYWLATEYYVKAYISEGSILNDTTFVITSSYRMVDGKKTEVTSRNETCHFRQFSPNPDSTNTFIE